MTTRPIPPEKSAQAEADQHAAAEQPKTIDPSLLNRTLDHGTTRRKLLFDTSSRRAPPLQVHEDALKRPKTRSSDVLVRAREMGKKIWTLEKLQKILDMVLETDPYKSAVLNHGRSASHGKESNLMQLLQNERVHGPSDRDPTVVTKELHYFKGFYIYVHDIEEKTKPVMVREYNKVADKKDGDWPQFRVASQGRCPFVEDFDDKEARAHTQAKEKVAKPAAPAPVPKPVTGKRTLVEMEDGQNRGAPRARDDALDQGKISNAPALDFRAPNQNAFMSRARSGRLLAGEPVASGLQQSNITSAIRSQMISSTSGILGAKAGTSREIHGLQRKVLQKASTPAVSQDLSSRQVPEMSHDSNGFLRSASLSRATSRKLEAVDEDEPVKPKEKLRRTVSVPVALTKKRDKKPGYCENCQDKFDDFDDVCFTPDASTAWLDTDMAGSTSSSASIAGLPTITTTGPSSTRSWANSNAFPSTTARRNGNDQRHFRHTPIHDSVPFNVHTLSTFCNFGPAVGSSGDFAATLALRPRDVVAPFSIFLAFIPLFKFILARLVARHRHCMMGHHSSKARGDLGTTAQITLPAYGVVFYLGVWVDFGWDFGTWTLLLSVLCKPDKAAV